ncbi:MAG: hypothetical protein JST50_11450 [Bacteroidetes bacterium]|nr:hypothetical protein [Bacteroidota bacterium]
MSWFLYHYFKNPSSISTAHIFAFFSPPLLFGGALILSNRNYLKKTNATSAFLIMLSFIVIFIWGTLPFYKLGQFLFDNPIAAAWVGCLSAFLFVALTTRFLLEQIAFGYVNLLLLILLPILCIVTFCFLTGQKLSEFEGNTISLRSDITVLVYQFFMSVLITSMIKYENRPA